MWFAGTQPGILKAVKRRENASFISSIDERLATSHVLLYDVDRKVRESALGETACVVRPTQSTCKIR